jgi:hypothetical protein
MKASGMTAARLTRPLPEAALPTADTLGLRLFVDLPAAYVTARMARGQQTRLIDAARALARLAKTHASLHAVGLVQNADTRDAEMCDLIDRWTGALRQHNASLQTYYVTAFPPDVDACATVPSRVLVDLRGSDAPLERWARWRQASAGAGVGAVGTWTAPDAAPGLHVPHSPERQARTLETLLPPLLAEAPVVFVSRWRDAPPEGPRRYGLHDASGRPRPALAVVQGLYTGAQTVFALPTGRSPEPPTTRVVLLGWGLIGMLLLLYARRPGAQRAAYRYVRAHPFYRDVLREGRDVLPVFSLALLVHALSTLGLVVYAVGRELAKMERITLLMESLPPGVREIVMAWLSVPAFAGVATAAILGGASALWMLTLTGVAQRYGRFTLRQALMLVAWPCWTAVPGLVVVLVLPSVAPVEITAFVLLAATALALCSTLGRVLRDYASVTAVPWPVAAALALPSPLVLLLLSGIGLALAASLSVRLLFALLWYA